jgi:hypothetical protein
MVMHHRTLLGHVITSLTLYPSVAIHRSDYFADLARQERCPQGDLSVAKTYYSPNLHLLRMVTEHQIAAARAAATAFRRAWQPCGNPYPPVGALPLIPPTISQHEPLCQGVTPR